MGLLRYHSIMRWPRPRLPLAIVLAIAATPLAQSHASDQGALLKPKPRCERTAFRVLLDVGHSAEDPGARSARGVTEYEFNLRLTREIERSLKDSGFTQTVVLVSEGAAIPSLILRMRRANAVPADLFVSIHHDSVPERFLEPWFSGGNPTRFNDRFPGHSIFVSFENSRAKGSLQFASLLGAQLKARELSYTPHYTERFMGGRQRELLDKQAGVYRFDKLFVLRTARMPAVLFEAGMIVNRDEELVLTTQERQNTMALAATDAIDSFCAQRQAAIRAAAEPRNRKISRPGRTHTGSAPTAARPAEEPATARLLR